MRNELPSITFRNEISRSREKLFRCVLSPVNGSATGPQTYLNWNSDTVCVLIGDKKYVFLLRNESKLNFMCHRFSIFSVVHLNSIHSPMWSKLIIMAFTCHIEYLVNSFPKKTCSSNHFFLFPSHRKFRILFRNLVTSLRYEGVVDPAVAAKLLFLDFRFFGDITNCDGRIHLSCGITWVFPWCST